MKAGVHSNACFWLNLGAGWSQCAGKRYDNEDLQTLYEEARSIEPAELTAERTTAFDKLGMVSDGLRQFMCGLNGYMQTNEAMTCYVPPFVAWHAVHCNSGKPATLADYKYWIAKVATIEFADELILAATAKQLRVCITTVPHTPPNNPPWIIAQHPVQDLWQAEEVTEDHEIVLGNDDVHYVYMKRQ